MKKTLLIVMCLLPLLASLNAQETTFSYNFDNNSFDGWTGYDADGDGYTWELHDSSISGGYDGSYGLYSSCYTNGELTPDNYLYTTDTYKITSTSRLYFMHRQSDLVYFQENFSVIISEDGVNFLEIWNEKYTEPMPGDKWEEATVDLSEYAGKNLYIGFRHHDCNGFTANGIRIDNVELLSEGESLEDNTITFNIYPNPVESQLIISTEENIENIGIFTLNGQIIYEGNYDKKGIDVSEFKAGVYFIKIMTNNREVVERFIKK
ncbi:MAG: choice-of-anchor J domain-containing protein [Bacteroidales bacterium]|nr:choice-of-anchor J domain-containing protein [Bacteroidales bacterium]